MKYKEALKKYNFVKRLNIPEKLYPKVFANLEGVVKGSDARHISPLGKQHDPIMLLVLWTRVVKANEHKLNAPLLDIENEQRRKFGPRSESTTWLERKPGLMASFHSQIDNFSPPFYKMKDGKGDLCPLPFAEGYHKVKTTTNSGLPKLVSKGEALDDLLENFQELIDRKDPCMLFTRTAESKKTRNVWGYPFADIFFEMLFFVPFLEHMRTKFWQASVVSPELVDIRITGLVQEAIRCGKILYSVDFDGFDASVSWQTIELAFDYIKSCFIPRVGKLIDMICLRFYTIEIVTPSGIMRGRHGVPSGSCFTNLIDSIVQAATALSNDFIHEWEMMINGDDGVYILHKEDIPQFEETFRKARLNLGTSKSHIAENWCTYCQRLYHIDYLKDDLIGGIYPTFRALNRLIWLEKFTNFNSKVKGKKRISSRDYFGSRTLTILEQCKYHPLFEELVRFILEREKFALSVTDEGIAAYARELAKGRGEDEDDLNFSESTFATGIKDFESYKLVQKIIAEEGYFDIVDFDELPEEEYDYED